jgi:hypothetical protein
MTDPYLFLAEHRARAAQLHREARTARLAAEVRAARDVAAPAPRTGLRRRRSLAPAR